MSLGATTHYDILLLPPTASNVQIRSAYLRLILIHHPDKQTAATTATTMMKSDTRSEQEIEAGKAMGQAIVEAFAILGNVRLRIDYDALLLARQRAARPPTAHRSYELSVPIMHFVGVYEHDVQGPTDPDYYAYPCRCSGKFVVYGEREPDPIEIVECDGCSARCRVLFHELDEGDNGDGGGILY